jgi:NAD kinase
MILVDPYNPRAKELYNALASVLNDTPITVVLGGDGWMLQCLREHHSLQPFLGLNAGTLGFLMNDVQDIQARSILKRKILHGSCTK